MDPSVATRAEVEALLIAAEQYVVAVIREATRPADSNDLAAAKTETKRARTALLDLIESIR